jgi:hypothetical protein
VPAALRVFLIGAAVIAAYWFVSSGCWKIPYYWLARLGRPLASVGLFCSLLLIGLVTFPFILVAGLVDVVHFQIRLRRLRKTRLSAAREEAATRELTEIYQKDTVASSEPELSFEDWKKKKGDKWIANEQARIADPVLQQHFESKTKFRLLRPWEKLLDAVGNLRIRLDSTALIGLAPFHSYSFDEELKSAKAPLQIFAASVRRLRLGLSDRMILSQVRFIPIPDIVSIESEDDARRWRKRLGLDTLLWGSYLSADPPRIWLNLEHRPQP